MVHTLEALVLIKGGSCGLERDSDNPFSSEASIFTCVEMLSNDEEFQAVLCTFLARTVIASHNTGLLSSDLHQHHCISSSPAHCQGQAPSKTDPR